MSFLAVADDVFHRVTYFRMGIFFEPFEAYW